MDETALGETPVIEPGETPVIEPGETPVIDPEETPVVDPLESVLEALRGIYTLSTLS